MRMRAQLSAILALGVMASREVGTASEADPWPVEPLDQTGPVTLPWPSAAPPLTGNRKQRRAEDAKRRRDAKGGANG